MEMHPIQMQQTEMDGISSNFLKMENRKYNKIMLQTTHIHSNFYWIRSMLCVCVLCGGLLNPKSDRILDAAGCLPLLRRRAVGVNRTGFFRREKEQEGRENIGREERESQGRARLRFFLSITG